MDIKIGDVVHVRCEVIDARPDMDGDVHVDFRYSMGRTDLYVLPSEIVHVEPRALAVGDIVKAPDSGFKLRIKALCGEFAWTCTEDVDPETVEGRVRPVSCLVRA